MRNIQYGDVVKVQGYDNGRQGSVIRVQSEDDILVQIGHNSIHVSQDMITVMSRSIQDNNGKRLEVKFHIGDKVRYTYPNPPANPEDEQQIRYGEITGFVSEKRVNVRWVGAGEDSIERVSRLKWIPMIPAWFVKMNGVN
jgi:ribosomal protein L24